MAPDAPPGIVIDGADTCRSGAPTVSVWPTTTLFASPLKALGMIGVSSTWLNASTLRIRYHVPALVSAGMVTFGSKNANVGAVPFGQLSSAGRLLDSRSVRRRMSLASSVVSRLRYTWFDHGSIASPPPVFPIV